MNHNRQLNCVIDARVSTDKQLQGKGLDDQEVICNFYVADKGWRNLETFSKSYSGRKEEREDFEAIKLAIKSYQVRGIPIDFYVIKSIDRFTRLGADVYSQMKRELTAMDVQLVDTRNIIQPEVNTLAHLGIEYSWSIARPSRKAELLEAEKSSDDVTDILTRMIGAEIGLTREGFSMRAPNDGYLNTKEVIAGQEMSVSKQNPNRAHFYKTIFEMRASGKYSDKEIVEKVNALGFMSVPHKKWKKINKKTKVVIGFSSPKPMSVKQMQKLVRRPMYAGVKYEKWNEKPVWLKFATGEEAIVPVEVFNKANRGDVYIKTDRFGTLEILTNYNNGDGRKAKRLKFGPLYIYDKMTVCHICNKPLKNSGPKGNKGKSGDGFHGYHCDRAVDGVKHYYRVPKNEYESLITNLLNRIAFSDSFKNKLEERLMKKYRERESEILGESISIGENVNELKREQQSLLESFNHTQSNVVRRNIEQRVDELEIRILKATEQRDKIEIQERDIKSFVKYAKDLVEHPAKMLANNRNPYTQKTLFGLVFDEPLKYSEIISGTPKLSFLFKLSDSKDSDESSLVIPRRIELRFLG